MVKSKVLVVVAISAIVVILVIYTQHTPTTYEVTFRGLVKDVSDPEMLGYKGWLVEVTWVESGQIQVGDQIWVGYGSYPPMPEHVDDAPIGAHVEVYGKLDDGEISLNGEGYYIIEGYIIGLTL